MQLKLTVEISEEERQLLLLGLALMALQRPGFIYACREAAKTLKGELMFENFMNYNADRVKSHG